MVYVESATNRIALLDFLCLLLLRLRSKKVIVFIRDVYIEMFPEQYANPRAKITLIVNKLSNFYLPFRLLETLSLLKLMLDKNY